MIRKKRSKLPIKSMDFSKPIDITVFGTDNDPCFGKHYNPDASECGMCGDAQVCAIILSQSMHSKREKVEKKQAFLDLEESKLLKVPLVVKMLTAKLKTAPKRRLTTGSVEGLINDRFNMNGDIPSEHIKRALKEAIMYSKKLERVKVGEHTYIKLKG